MKNNFENIITVENDKITSKINEKEVIFSSFSKENLEIHIGVQKDCTLILTTENVKSLSLYFDVKENTCVKFCFLKKRGNSSYEEKYSLEKNSSLILNKICFPFENKENVSVYLEGEKAKVEYICKVIGFLKVKMDTHIYHHANDTECILYNHGVQDKEGTISFLVSNVVPKGVLHTKINQNSQIISFNDKKSEIKPNLFIDENEVEASHSAHVGPFSSSLLFYLQSRGISKERAYNLLLKGYIRQKLFFEEERLSQIIDQYWR